MSRMPVVLSGALALALAITMTPLRSAWAGDPKHGKATPSPPAPKTPAKPASASKPKPKAAEKTAPTEVRFERPVAPIFKPRHFDTELYTQGAFVPPGDPVPSRPAQAIAWVQFERFPYADDGLGWTTRRPDRDKAFAGRVSVGGAYLRESWAARADNTIEWRADVALDVYLWRLSMHHDVGFYIEEPPRDARYQGASDVAFAVVMRPRAVLSLGTGLNYLIDGRVPTERRRSHALGANGTARLLVFPVKRMVLAGRFDIGNLSSDVAMVVEGTAGLVVQGFEVLVGYELRTLDRDRQSGPTVRVRAWF